MAGVDGGGQLAIGDADLHRRVGLLRREIGLAPTALLFLVARPGESVFATQSDIAP
jgi:hypothetical protein